MSGITTKEQMDSFDFVLEAPLRYGQGGEMLETDTVQMVAPAAKMKIKAFKFSQMIGSAMGQASVLLKSSKSNVPTAELDDAQKEEKKETEAEVFNPGKEGNEVRTFVLLSELDMETALKVFYKLASKGCVMVEEMPINFIQWKEISDSDKIEMFFQFSGVFIMPSLFST